MSAPRSSANTRDALQRLGHVALVDAQRQAFGERGLADAGLADQQRVVLAAPAQHLDHALELELAADQRIDRRPWPPWRRDRSANASSGSRRRRPPRRRPARGRRLPSSPPCEMARSSVSRSSALLAQEVRRVAVVFLQQEHEQRAALHLLRARRGGVHDGAFDDAIEAERRFGLDGFLPGTGVNAWSSTSSRSVAQRRQVDAAARQDLARLRIFDQRVQQVLEADEIVTAIRRRRGTRGGCSRAFRGRTERGCGSCALLLGLGLDA